MYVQVKGEIELTQESLTMYQNTESAVHRSRKQYQQCVDHYAKVKGKLDRVKVESPSNPKLLGVSGCVLLGSKVKVNCQNYEELAF